MAFGKHLVGDPFSGTIFEMSTAFNDDFGNIIRRVRRSPYICDERKMLKHNYIQVDLEVGLGPIPPLTGGQSDSPLSFVVQASDGSQWEITVDDAGMLGSASTSGATPETVVLNDAANSSFSWLIGADITGNITTTPLLYSSLNPSVFSMATTSGFLQSGITITHVGGNFGLLETLIPIPANRDPQLILKWSNDDAKTWSNEYLLNCGQAGQYKKRVIKRRLGASRSRIYEISVTDPIPWRIADAYVDVS
jgi:hypothetical protein